MKKAFAISLTLLALLVVLPALAKDRYVPGTGNYGVSTRKTKCSRCGKEYMVGNSHICTTPDRTSSSSSRSSSTDATDAEGQALLNSTSGLKLHETSYTPVDFTAYQTPAKSSGGSFWGTLLKILLALAAVALLYAIYRKWRSSKNTPAATTQAPASATPAASSETSPASATSSTASATSSPASAASSTASAEWVGANDYLPQPSTEPQIPSSENPMPSAENPMPFKNEPAPEKSLQATVADIAQAVKEKVHVPSKDEIARAQQRTLEIAHQAQERLQNVDTERVRQRAQNALQVLLRAVGAILRFAFTLCVAILKVCLALLMALKDFLVSLVKSAHTR